MKTLKTFTTFRMIYETAMHGICSNIINGVKHEDAQSALIRFLAERKDTLIRIIQTDEIV